MSTGRSASWITHAERGHAQSSAAKGRPVPKLGCPEVVPRLFIAPSPPNTPFNSQVEQLQSLTRTAPPSHNLHHRGVPIGADNTLPSYKDCMASEAEAAPAAAPTDAARAPEGQVAARGPVATAPDAGAGAAADAGPDLPALIAAFREFDKSLSVHKLAATALSGAAQPLVGVVQRIYRLEDLDVELGPAEARLQECLRDLAQAVADRRQCADVGHMEVRTRSAQTGGGCGKGRGVLRARGCPIDRVSEVVGCGATRAVLNAQAEGQRNGPVRGAEAGMHWKGGRYTPPPPPGRPAYAQPMSP